MEKPNRNRRFVLKFTAIVIAILHSVIIVGCTSVPAPPVLHPVESEANVAYYRDGRGFLLSVSNDVMAGATALAAGKLTRFDLAIANHGSERINIAPEQFVLFDSRGQLILQKTENDLRQVIASSDRRQRFALGLQAFGAGLSSNTTEHHSGTIGGVPYAGTTTRRDSAALEANMRNIEQRRREVEDERQSQNLFIESRSLRRHTLMPGETFLASIYIEPPKPRESVTLKMIFEGQVFSFTFTSR